MQRLCAPLRAQLSLLALLCSLVLPLPVSHLTICLYNSYQELYRAFIPLTQSYSDHDDEIQCSQEAGFSPCTDQAESDGWKRKTEQSRHASLMCMYMHAAIDE